jgi:hypothetical protein
MDAGAVAATLEDAQFDARQASRNDDLVDDARVAAELAEWKRIDQLLAAASASTVYAPETDDFVRAELAAEAAAAATREAELREAARAATRADELRALRELGILKQAVPRTGNRPRGTMEQPLALRNDLSTAWTRSSTRSRTAPPPQLGSRGWHAKAPV